MTNFNNKRPKRNELAIKLLNLLVRGALTYRALSLAFLTSGRSSRLLSKRTYEELEQSENDYYKFLEKQRFYNLISKLKREGLIEARGIKYQLTKIGKLKLQILKSKILPKADYKKEKDGQVKIVTYDIAEKERQKRDWIRSSLRNLGFYPLQESVWISKFKLPIQFIKDLKKMMILESVHIFTISQEGTLHKYPVNLD